MSLYCGTVWCVRLRTNKLLLLLLLLLLGARGGGVVKVLRYKSEGRWFDSRWCHWNFSLT
jgi:hypothetical protein